MILDYQPVEPVEVVAAVADVAAVVVAALVEPGIFQRNKIIERKVVETTFLYKLC